MKCSLGISNFLEEISSLSHSIVFLDFFALITKEGFLISPFYALDFPGGSDGKAYVYNVGDPSSSPGSGRSPGEGNDNPLQDSCLENPIDKGTWWATVHRAVKNQTQLSDFIFSLLFTAICKASSDNHFAFLYLFFLGMVLIPAS